MSSITSTIKQLPEELNKLGSELRALAAQDSCNGTMSQLPLHIEEGVRLFENIVKQPLDWKDLDTWLGRAKKVTDTHCKYIQTVRDLGIDIDEMAKPGQDLNDIDLINRLCERNPVIKMVPIIYGPNWPTCYEQIKRTFMLKFSSDTNTAIPLDKARDNITDTADRIMSVWNDLNKRQEELKTFEEKWTRIRTSSRSAWLRNNFELQPTPNFVLHLLAQRSGNEPLDKQAFLAPLLNVEYLAQADNLPRLLHTRSAVPPKRFLSIDAQFVSLGYWFEVLAPLKIEGGVSFYSSPGEQSAGYGIQLENDIIKHPWLLSPAIGLYKLKAQEYIYSFLVSCVSRARDLPLPDVDPSDSNENDTELSLLGRSARMNYRQPDRIDWLYLQSVIDASCEEALDDLWKLRTDAEFWLMRITQMGKDASVLLYSVFKRIDTLLCLKERIKATRLSGVGGIESPAPSENIKQLKEVISLDRVLHTIFNEALVSLQDTVRSSRWQRKGTRTFCYLFDMLVKDDPTLRVIGLCPVLRTMERELSKANVHDCDPMPFSLQQALNDISVVSVCKEGASTHYQYIRNINHEYASSANKAETEWNGREKPWISLINRTLEILGRGVNNLNQSLSKRELPLSEKHRKFWTTVDMCMSRGTTLSPVFKFIQHEAPIPTAPAFPTGAPCTAHSMQSNDVALTQTQRNRARGRKSSPPHTSRSPCGSANAPTVVGTPPLPVVYVHNKEDRDFWCHLLNGKGQTTFSQWATFLSNLGFIITCQLGSGRRFERMTSDGHYHAIVYHEPHGRNGNKISYSQARKWWAGRLQTYFDVIVDNGSID